MALQTLNGMPVILNDALEPVQQNLKWWQKIIAWNPCNAELLPPKPKPRDAYIVQGKIIMAPSMYAILKNHEAVKPAPSFVFARAV